MPMLHSCSYPGCPSLTFGAYCLDHEALAPTPSTPGRFDDHDAHDDEQPVTTA
jgi:hypothetical protein